MLREQSGKAQQNRENSTTRSIYAAFTHGLSSKWNYLLRVTDWDQHQHVDVLDSLEKAIHSHFIPACTHRVTSSRGTYARDVSTTCTNWWFGPD